MVGEVLAGRYRIERLLGQGGMGSVYEATHTGTGRRVAVKVITASDLSPGDPRLARFEREARAAGSLVTEHIAGVLDAGEDGATGAPFMVMEYLEGEDLQHLLKRIGPLKPDAALRIAAQACLGLQKAHDAGVIHRDIKPANLFLTRREEGAVLVKLLDFGIAKMRVDDTVDPQTALTNTGNVLGSPHYLSPEQARAAKDVDPRTDVWSLGVTLYRALTGRTPHEKLDSFINLMMAICLQPSPPVQSFAPWVPDEVAEIAHRALAIERDDRFPSAAAMLDAMRPLLPDGWALHTSMLVPLDEGDRAAVSSAGTRRPSTAPGHDGLAETPSGARRDGGAETPASARAAAFRKSSIPPIAAVTAPAGAAWDAPGTPTVPVPGATPATLAGPARARPRGSVALAAAALAGVGLVAVLVAARSGGSPAAPAPSADPTARAAATSAAAAPPDPPVVTPTRAAEPVRRVKLVIEPSDATAEIDGAPAPSDHGVIDVTGPLGSIHRVHLHKGKIELTGDVAVTESGALPPKLELAAGPAPARAPGKAADPSGPGAPSAQAPPKPRPAASSPGLRTDFE